MDYWYSEGTQAAQAEFVKGDILPAHAELVRQALAEFDLDDDDAESFALGWLAKARQIQASEDDGPCPLRAWYDTRDELK